MKPKATTAAEMQSSLLIFIAYRRGSEEGDPVANWLNEHLKYRQLTLDPEHKTTIATYFDQHAPAIHDWTQKWKGDLRTARAMILVASPGSATRRPGTDWLYDEIEWWISHRRTAPLLVLAGRDEPSWVPLAIARRWPRAQRLAWCSQATPDQRKVLLERITDGLILSERGISYEELRRLQVRNRGLVGLTLATLVLGVLSLFFANSQRQQRELAERNLELSYGPSLQVALAAHSKGDNKSARNILLGINRRLRGVEWRLLRNLVDQSERTWEETENITDIEYSPNGSLLALAHEDGKVSVRRMRSDYDRDLEIRADGGRVESREALPANSNGEQLVRTTSSPPKVSALHFLGEHLLATTGNDGRVHLWDLYQTLSGILSYDLSPSDTAGRRTLAISPDNSLLASGTENGFVHIWQIGPDLVQVRGAPIATVNVGWEPVSMVFSADSQSLVIVGNTILVKPEYSAFTLCWHWHGGDKPQRLEAPVSITALARLGEAVYGGRGDGSVVSWDLKTAKIRIVLPADPERGSITQMQSFPESNVLGLAASNRIYLWKPTDGTVRTVSGAEDNITSFRIGKQPGAPTLISASGREAKFYDLGRTAPRTDLLGDEAQLVDVSADGRIVVSISLFRGFIRISNFASGTHLDVPTPKESYSVLVFPNGSRFVVGWRDGSIRCYRTSRRSPSLD